MSEERKPEERAADAAPEGAAGGFVRALLRIFRRRQPAAPAPAEPALAQVSAEEDGADSAQKMRAQPDENGHIEPTIGRYESAAESDDAWEGAPLPKDARLSIDGEGKGAAGLPMALPGASAAEASDEGAAPLSEERSARRRRFPWKAAAETCVVFLVAAGAWWGADRIAALPYFNLERLEMKGDTAKVPLARLKDAVEGAVTGNYFSADLDQVRAAAETVPWVKRAFVRRLWPNGLEVTVDVYHAMAVYEDGRLVSTEGVLFSANPEEGAEAVDLPNFYGAPSQVNNIARHYKIFSAAAAAIPAKITDVTLSDRGAWTLVMASSDIPPTKVELGRDDADEDSSSEAASGGGAAEAASSASSAASALFEAAESLFKGGEPAKADGGQAFEPQCLSAKRFAAVVAAYPLVESVLKGPPSSIDARYRRGFAAGLVDRKAVAAWREEMAAKRAAAPPAPAIAPMVADEPADAADEAAEGDRSGIEDGAGAQGAAKSAPAGEDNSAGSDDSDDQADAAAIESDAS